MIRANYTQRNNDDTASLYIGINDGALFTFEV